MCRVQNHDQEQSISYQGIQLFDSRVYDRVDIKVVEDLIGSRGEWSTISNRRLYNGLGLMVDNLKVEDFILRPLWAS